MMIEKIGKCSLIAVVSGLAVYSLSCEENKIANLKQDAKLSSPLRSITTIASALAEVMPDWDDSIKSTEEVSMTSVIGPSPLDAVSNIVTLYKKDFTYLETRNNGTVVYKSTHKDGIIKWHRNDGMWKFLSADNYISLKNTKETYDFPESLAQKNTEELFASFSLPSKERGVAYVMNIGVADEGAEKGALMARAVIIPRLINNIVVNSSYFRVSYDIDGSPFRVELRWPSFSLNENATIIGRETAIKEIASALVKEGSEPSNFSAFIVYEVDKETGDHDPTVYITIGNGENEFTSGYIRYSLTSGLWNPKVETSGTMINYVKEQ